MQDAFFPIFEKLYQGENLDQATCYDLFSAVIQGQLDSIELAALVIALKIKGETSSEIAGAAAAMRDNALSFPRPDYAFSDLVGTGGDGHNTINISSAAAVVAASCGIKVAKHGNRSVSSMSGSSDLFAGFGIALDMSPQTARECLDQANLCFLAAPFYHTGIKHAMPVRIALKTRTLFNILGPLANPAKPTHGIYGVYKPELVEVYAQTLQTLGHQNALVVHGSGLDEIALHGSTEAIHVHNGKLIPMTLNPIDFGIESAPLSAIKGGSPDFNVEAISKVFSGNGETAHIHAIAMNAASLIWLHEQDKANPMSLQACFEQAITSTTQGKPMQTIELVAKISQGKA